MILIFTSKV